MQRQALHWDRLVFPLIEIKDIDHRDQSIALAALTLIIIALTQLGAVALLLTSTITWQDFFPAVLARSGLYLIPYFLARLGRVRLVIGLAVILTIALSLQAARTFGVYDAVYVLNFLYAIALFASAFWSMKVAAFLVFIECVIVAAITLGLLGGTSTAFVTRAVLITLVVGVFSLLLMRYWRASLARREQALQASEQRYRMVSELASDYTFYYRRAADGSLVREWMTETFERITGYRLDEVPDVYFTQLYHPDDRERVAADRIRVLAGETVEAEYRIVRKDHEVRWIAIKRVPELCADGRTVIGQFGVVTDITERKLTHERMLRLALRQQQYALVNDLVAAISHDFRTRLATVESSRYLIGKLAEHNATPDQYARRLSTIEEAVVQMTAQLNNLSTIASLKNVVMARVDLQRMLHSVHARFVARAAAQQVVFAQEADPALPLVTADEAKLDVALEHLVRNALDHTPAGGRVWMRAAQAADGVILEVGDAGEGISADMLAHVFEPFFRANDARTAEESGLGLGLTIVKIIADLHGASLDVESTPGRGSIFRLRLRLEVAEAAG